MDDSLQRGLDAVAAHLGRRRDRILDAWSAAAKADPRITPAGTLSRAQFFDHMPKLLDALEQELRGGAAAREAAADEVVDAHGHGLQRWQQGFNEREVLREWLWLERCLGVELEALASAQPTLTAEVMANAWRVTADFLVRGMSASVEQHAALQRADATTRLLALEDAHAALADLERQRADAWRQATHDLRGNVALVHNATALLQAQRERDAPLEASLAVLERSVQALHALLEDLTSQARLDAGREQRRVQPFDVATLLGELCTTSVPIAARRGLALRCDGPPSLPVEGDAVKVRRIAQNLLLNAVDYTEEGGITLRWQPIDGQPQSWALIVADTGPGMPDASGAPISTALEAATRHSQAEAPAPGETAQSRRSAPSTGSAPAHEGLGLAIVKRLCELLDATLELVTAPGHGTTFRVIFPVAYPKG